MPNEFYIIPVFKQQKPITQKSPLASLSTFALKSQTFEHDVHNVLFAPSDFEKTMATQIIDHFNNRCKITTLNFEDVMAFNATLIQESPTFTGKFIALKISNNNNRNNQHPLLPSSVPPLLFLSDVYSLNEILYMTIKDYMSSCRISSEYLHDIENSFKTTEVFGITDATGPTGIFHFTQEQLNTNDASSKAINSSSLPCLKVVYIPSELDSEKMLHMQPCFQNLNTSLNPH